MSTYIVSDVHGCLKEFEQLLEKISFSDKDELYVLGDVFDRGKEPVAVLKDIMKRSNAFFIKGNHEFMALKILKKIIGRDLWDVLSEDGFFYDYYTWMRNGGEITLDQFRKLSKKEQEEIIFYLENACNYEMLEIYGKSYILVHGGLGNFKPDKGMDMYLPRELLWARADYKKRYYPDEKIFLVTGHTPTPLIREDKKPLVYEKNGHIAVDCGCCFGGRLAAYCPETGEITYIDSEKFRGDTWETKGVKNH